MSTFNELITKSDKQNSMAAAWQDNKALKKEAIEQANIAYKAAKQQAEADKKEALEEHRKALHETPQDPAKVQAASEKVEQANKALVQAKSVRDEAMREAKTNYNTRHDDLRAAEKAHNNDSWDKTFNQDMTLKEMRAEEDNILHGTGSSSEGSSSEGSSSEGSSSESSSSESSSSEGSSSEGSSSEGSSSEGSIRDGIRFSDSFYRDIGAAVRGQRTGNLYDAAAVTAKEQAQNYRNRSAINQMEGQRSQQIADRNPYAEAGKIASVQNDAENRQDVRKSGLLGSGAALARHTNAPDVQSQMARADQQQNVANQRRDEANTAQEEATAKEGDAKNFQIKSRDHNIDRNEASDLSLGKDTTAQADPETIQTDTPERQPNDQPQQPTEQPSPQKEEPDEAFWQDLMDYITFGKDTTSDNWGKGNHPNFNETKQYAETHGWEPIQASQAEYDGDLGHLQKLVEEQQPKFYEAWSARSGRVGEDGSQINRGDQGDEIIDSAKAVETAETADTPSDTRIKDIHTCLSDLEMKYIKEDFDKYGRCAPPDFIWLLSKAGKLKHNEREYDALGTEDFSSDNDVLEAYRDHIKNYVYNYKPEAVDIDPRIDPNEEHIGPMAQDIEQVNPACVKETADGVKTVDTARLAMMNAGAIGDLARQLDELNKKFQALGL